MTLYRTSVVIAPVVIVILLASTLAGIDRLAFRDVSHFYLPLYDYVAARTSQSWLPLWNPLDQTGMPLIGETTTAVLYPIRYLVFALPLPSEVALGWYVALHLILASFTSRWAALRSGASPMAATLAGVIYPLSGGVFFLHTNPPYLVGASWLPLVVAALVSRESMSARNRCLVAAPAMAMMILGGDPQSALHAMLIATAVYAARLRHPDTSGTRRMIAISLIAAPFVAALLTAPQLAASLSWSSQSARVISQDTQPWHEPPALGTQRRDVFQFSLPPWHAASLLTPNAWGRLFPEYQRISVMMPGDGRIWTPSIYLGLLAALAITGRMLRRELDVWVAIAIASFLLSLGHFGVVWLLQQMPAFLPNVDSAIGGPYWFLYRFLPGYDSFRYPVKWLPFFALAISVTTSLWIDSAKWPTIKTTCVIVAVLLIACLAAGTILCSLAKQPTSYNDVFWGPLDLKGGLKNLWWSAGHSLIALIVVGLTLRALCRQRRPPIFVLLIIITGIDLGFSDHQWIARVSRSDERTLLSHYRQEPLRTTSTWLRVRRHTGWPSTWRQTSNRSRLLEVAASERLAWFGRWHLADRQAVLNNMTSIQGQQIALFWQACERVTADQSDDQSTRYWQSVRRWLSINSVVIARSSAKQAMDASLVDVTRRTENDDAPRFRFHSKWLLNDNLDLDAFAEFLQAMDQAGGNPDPIIHSRDQALVQESLQTKAEYRITPISDDEVNIETDGGGVLSRPVLQDGHWRAEIRPADSQQWEAARVHRISFLKQGIMLSPGNWHVRFVYRPWWLPASLMIAIVSWLSFGWVAIRCLRIM